MKPSRSIIATLAALAIAQLAYDYYSAPIYFPHLKYVTLETASEITHDWFQEAKEKRNRKDMVQLAKSMYRKSQRRKQPPLVFLNSLIAAISKEARLLLTVCIEPLRSYAAKALLSGLGTERIYITRE